MTSPTKVHFRLVQDEDGYPPAAVESVWADSGANPNEYVISNVPFFTRDATIGDTVLVRQEEGQCWFDRMVHRSPNSLIRVVFFDQTSMRRVNEHLETMGCLTEYIKAHSLLAVSIPGNVRLSDVQDYLRAEARAGSIDFEEPLLRQ